MYQYWSAAIATIFLTLTCTCAANGEVYRVVDDEGRVSYTDQPPAEGQLADRINIGKPNTQTALPVNPPETTHTAATDPGASPVKYDRVEIGQPGNNTTIPPGQLDVVVQITIEPTLAAGHKVVLLHNGAPIGDPVAATSFVIGDLVRGAHELQAQIISEKGKTVASSPIVVIHVKRASRLNQPS